MGWSNYIIIPKWKLFIEVSRSVDCLEDYEETAIEKAINEENIDFDSHLEGESSVSMGDVPIHKITIKDLTELYRSYDMIQSLSGMDYDKLLLYWLKARNIEFSIESEFEDSVKECIKEGYTRIER
jgi:hypothetical protein